MKNLLPILYNFYIQVISNYNDIGKLKLSDVHELTSTLVYLKKLKMNENFLIDLPTKTIKICT
jgi:hypothetical protein